jgi:hypothetical protein
VRPDAVLPPEGGSAPLLSCSRVDGSLISPRLSGGWRTSPYSWTGKENSECLPQAPVFRRTATVPFSHPDTPGSHSDRGLVASTIFSSQEVL